VTAIVIVLGALVLVLGGTLVYRGRKPIAHRVPRGGRRILVPFTGGELDPDVLGAAIRVARAEDAVLVPAYLLVVPLEYPEESPLTKEVSVAMPVLEAVEHAALRAGVPVDARIEKGRTPTPALGRLWQVEQSTESSHPRGPARTAASRRRTSRGCSRTRRRRHSSSARLLTSRTATVTARGHLLRHPPDVADCGG
jgi:hypothetical protein